MLGPVVARKTIILLLACSGLTDCSGPAADHASLATGASLSAAATKCSFRMIHYAAAPVQRCDCPITQGVRAQAARTSRRVYPAPSAGRWAASGCLPGGAARRGAAWRSRSRSRRPPGQAAPPRGAARQASVLMLFAGVEGHHRPCLHPAVIAWLDCMA